MSSKITEKDEMIFGALSVSQASYIYDSVIANSKPTKFSVLNLFSYRSFLSSAKLSLKLNWSHLGKHAGDEDL